MRGALAHVRNRAQMTVRIIDTGSLPGPLRGTRPTTSGYGRAGPAEGGPAGPTRGPGTRYLRSRAVATAREKEVAGFDPVRAAVARWLRDERVDRRDRIATVYHLIPRASAEAYHRAIVRAAVRAGLRVIVSGPWPAYAFADTF